MPILDRPMKMLMMHPTQFTMGLLGLSIVCMHEAQIYVCTHQMRKINCSTNIEQHKCLDPMVFFYVYYCHSNLKNQEGKNHKCCSYGNYFTQQD